MGILLNENCVCLATTTLQAKSSQTQVEPRMSRHVHGWCSARLERWRQIILQVLLQVTLCNVRTSAAHYCFQLGRRL